MNDPARDRKRLRELLALRSRIDAEIATLRDNALEHTAPQNRTELNDEIRATEKRLEWLTSLLPPPRRSRLEPAECGTESGYQRHKYLWRTRKEGVWPLPKDDPCGCRAGHARHEAQRVARRQWETAA